MAGLAPDMLAERIHRFSRIVSDRDHAEAFYREALGFRTVSRGPSDPAVLAALGLGLASECVLQLGADIVALVKPASPGRPYPPQSRNNDLWFQHLAIVVDDMGAAYAHLAAFAGWRPISKGGPQLLPPATGSVRAFKFRDPDGHPLELIWFPPGQGRNVWHRGGRRTPFLGIDHSALAVSATPRSRTFYRRLGFHVSDSSRNHGPAQARLDGLPRAFLRVSGLRPASDDGPGLELLGYHPPGRGAVVRVADLATDWVTIGVSGGGSTRPIALRDPDGHRLVLLDQGPAVEP